MSAATFASQQPSSSSPDQAVLFTCMACAVGFHTADLQRQHYRTDWHRYNLKRKVVDLPPVTADSFAEKVLQQHDAKKVEQERATFSANCAACKKTFYSPNAFQNHLKSKKHMEATGRYEARMMAERERVGSPAESMISSTFSIGESSNATGAAPLADEIDKMSIQDEAPERTEEEEIEARLANAAAVNVHSCIFCSPNNPPFSAVDECLKHMSARHGLFIPERDYLTDLEGLLRYLQEKINVGHACLSCHKEYRSAEACRAHMISKEHCKIKYDTQKDMLEYSDFYDFSASYSDVEGEEDAEMVDGDAEDVESGDWEDVSEYDSDEDSIASEDLGSLPVDPQYSLYLPNRGISLGHRSLHRYYRQHLRPAGAVPDGVKVHRQAIQAAVMENKERSLMGVTGGRRKEAEKHIKTFRDMRRREDYKTTVGIKVGNNQKYFRDPLLQ
ncbi:pre-60S factor rei1 [Saitoella coloradoensis]